MKQVEKRNAFQAYKLFVNLEGKEMVGRRFFNFWVLVGIFILTIGSVSFSHGGLEYLRYKMEDPFINWVDIIRHGNFDRLKQDLQKDEYKDHYKYASFEKNQNLLYMFRNWRGKDIRFEGRTVDTNSSLLAKIFDPENVIQYKGKFYENDYGLIITQEMALKLGFESNLPSHISMAYPLNVPSAKKIGLISETQDEYYSISLPVIAIVKQLPDMMSFMATPFFYAQRRSLEDPFDLTKTEYNDHLELYIPSSSVDLEEKIKKEVSQQFISYTPKYQKEIYNISWLKGYKLVVNFDSNMDTLRINNFSNDLLSKYKNEGLIRIYTYNFTDNEEEEEKPDYLSIHFNSLDSIRAFQQFLKDQYEVKIDMSQIDSKENFNFVNSMGIALSIGFVIMSCVFIFTFIFYLLRTHFLKIKKNLGTFKAFGISNKELKGIYLTIMLAITTCAFFISYIIILLLQILLSLFNIQIDSNFAYIDVLSIWSIGIFVLAISTSIIATWIVTNSLLKATPGDLIYDRDI